MVGSVASVAHRSNQSISESCRTAREAAHKTFVQFGLQSFTAARAPSSVTLGAVSSASAMGVSPGDGNTRLSHAKGYGTSRPRDRGRGVHVTAAHDMDGCRTIARAGCYLRRLPSASAHYELRPAGDI